MIVAGELGEGQTLVVDYADERFVFEARDRR
jgi:hypothetical protein